MNLNFKLLIDQKIFIVFEIPQYNLFIFFFIFSHYKVLLEEQEHPVRIVKQQLQRYGEETKVVNPFVMHVDFIINYTM